MEPVLFVRLDTVEVQEHESVQVQGMVLDMVEGLDMVVVLE